MKQYVLWPIIRYLLYHIQTVVTDRKKYIYINWETLCRGECHKLALYPVVDKEKRDQMNKDEIMQYVKKWKSKFEKDIHRSRNQEW
jgi:hypothetical protein